MGGWAKIAAGGSHTLLLEDGGRLFALGLNADGQLGDGTTINRATPTPVTFTPPRILLDIRCGAAHSLALTSDGEVYAWGRSLTGESLLSPTLVEDLGEVVAVSAGGSFSLALDDQGRVFFWGRIPMGDGAPSSSLTGLTPTLIEGLPTITALAAGWSHALVLDSEGNVWAWGANGQGALGDGTTLDRATPVRLPLPTGEGWGEGVTHIAAGAGFSVAITTGGDVWTWGDGRLGQLGDGTFSSRATPARVPGLSGVTAVACGGAYVLVIADGSVLGWGYNRYGALAALPLAPPPQQGHPPSPLSRWECSPSPAPLGLSGADQLSAGGHHALTLTPEGQVWSWGLSSQGQTGAEPTAPKLPREPASGAPLKLPPGEILVPEQPQQPGPP